MPEVVIVVVAVMPPPLVVAVLSSGSIVVVGEPGLPTASSRPGRTIMSSSVGGGAPGGSGIACRYAATAPAGSAIEVGISSSGVPG